MSKYTIYPGNSVNYISKKGTLYKISNKKGSLLCISNGKRCKPTKEILSKFTVPGGFFTIYTDGGCINNPGGKGGYGVVIITPAGDIQKLSKGFWATTNNRMELMGAIDALKSIPRYSEVSLYSDSKYLVLTMNGAYQKNKNLDLWELLEKECKVRNVSFHWIKGHSGNALNEVCDKLATEAMNQKHLELDKGYNGKPAKTPKHTKIIANKERPKQGRINKICKDLMDAFHLIPSPSFKDYAKLKTGGRDAYSEMGISELQSLCKADLNEIKPYISENDLIYVLRWNCRGLSLRDSIKKVLVDKEISENAMKKRNNI